MANKTANRPCTQQRAPVVNVRFPPTLKKTKKTADSVGGGSHGEGCSRKKKLKAYTFHETTLQTVSGNKRVTFVEKKASLVILFPL